MINYESSGGRKYRGQMTSFAPCDCDNRHGSGQGHYTTLSLGDNRVIINVERFQASGMSS